MQGIKWRICVTLHKVLWGEFFFNIIPHCLKLTLGA
jgi:hypothetical protein